VDGLGFTYGEFQRAEVLAHLVELQGGEGSPCGGKHGYAEGISWGEGTFLLWGGDSQRDTCHASLAGELIEHRPWAEQMAILKRCLNGGRCTMMHLALDIMGNRPTELLDDVRSWAQAGWLRNFRRVSDQVESNVQGGECSSRGGGIYLGSKSSTRRVLVYDKGAKLGISYDGRHVRIEFRVRSDVAQLMSLELNATPTQLKAAHLVLGSIDWADEFGEVPARWLELVNLVGGVEPLTVAREATSFDAFVSWARRALGGRLSEMAYLSGVPVEDLAAQLFAGIQPKKPGRIDRCLQEYQSGHGFSSGPTVE